MKRFHAVIIPLLLWLLVPVLVLALFSLPLQCQTCPIMKKIEDLKPAIKDAVYTDITHLSKILVLESYYTGYSTETIVKRPYLHSVSQRIIRRNHFK